MKKERWAVVRHYVSIASVGATVIAAASGKPLPIAVVGRGIGRDTCPRRSSAKEFAYWNGEAAVKAFLVACLASIVLAAISWIVLNDAQETADRAFATPPYTRVGD
jgi:hypothetical protein